MRWHLRNKLSFRDLVEMIGRMSVRRGACTFSMRCWFSAFGAGIANFSLYCFMSPGRKALPTVMSAISASLSSFTSRSCGVRFARSTRPLAWLEFAQRISMLLRQRAPKLRHTRTALCIRPVHPENRVLVGVEHGRATMLF